MVNLVSMIADEITRLELTEQSFNTPQLRKINQIKIVTGTLEIEGDMLGEKNNCNDALLLA